MAKKKSILRRIWLKHSRVPDKNFVKEELDRGTNVEMEHTTDPRVARDIAKAHLIETGKITRQGKISSKYYDELSKMEKKLKKHNK